MGQMLFEATVFTATVFRRFWSISHLGSPLVECYFCIQANGAICFQTGRASRKSVPCEYSNKFKTRIARKKAEIAQTGGDMIGSNAEESCRPTDPKCPAHNPLLSNEACKARSLSASLRLSNGRFQLLCCSEQPPGRAGV